MLIETCMPTVTVLMSSYNGDKYIREQIDSLLSQKGVEVKIVIRDDGSKDQTNTILAEYSSKYKKIKIIKGENCGAEESFNRLCKYAVEEEPSDFYAFCDQDDVWDEDKLSIAINNLNGFDMNQPLLYFSNLKMVDENLNYIRDFYNNEEVFTDKSKTLVQIFTYGCTCVFNRKALEYYCRVVPQTTLHDNWLYCICSYLGKVIYDPCGHIQYRQHENNLSGHRTTGFSLLIYRIRRLFKGNLGHDFETMAKQMLHFSDELSIKDKQMISLVADYRNSLYSRLRLFFLWEYQTGNIFKDICIRYRILSNSL